MVKRLYTLELGSVLTLDGRPWLLRRQTPTGYEVEGLLDDGQPSGTDCHLDFGRVDAALKAGKCRVQTPRDYETLVALRQFAGGYDNVSALPKDAQALIECRLEMVLAMGKLEERGAKVNQRSLNQPEMRAELAEIIAADRFAARKGKGKSKRAPSIELPTGRTLMTYLQRYRQFDGNPVALMQRNHLKGPPPEKRGKLDALQEQFLSECCFRWSNTKKPIVTAIYALLDSAYRDVARKGNSHLTSVAQFFRAPSITTLRNRISRMSLLAKVNGREGRRAAGNLAGAGSSSTRALMLGELIETDEVLLSIFVKDSGKISMRMLSLEEALEPPSKDELLRAWMSVALDLSCRMPLAWVLSAAPSAEHTMRLYNMINLDKSGIAKRYSCRMHPAPPVNPLRVSQDNGTAQRNGRVRAAQLGAGIIVNDARTARAIDKPNVERFFARIEADLISLINGYCGRRPGHLPGEDPKAAAGLTLDKLYGILTRYFIDEYPYKAHFGTGMFGATPHQKMTEVINDYGVLPPLDTEARRMRFGISRTMRPTKQGVKIGVLGFNSTALQRHRDLHPKDQVEIRLDPSDLKAVSVIVPGSTQPITAQLTDSVYADATFDDVLRVVQANAERALLQKLDPADPLHQARLCRVNELGWDRRDVPDGYLNSEEIEATLRQLQNVSDAPQSRPQLIVPASADEDEFVITLKPGGRAAKPRKEAEDDTAKANAPPQFTQITESKL